jgi:glycosyltransferase involved in cell wall biosynthesis
MRILMLSQFYPPTVGGEERHVADLSTELVARGHQVAVATLWQKGFPRFESVNSVRIHRIRGTLQRMEALFSYKDRRFAPPFTDPEVLWGLHHIISEERPDIIHAHNWIVHSFTPMKAWSKASLVVTLHDYSLVCVQKRLMQFGVNCSGPGFRKCLSCAANFYGVGKGVPSALANFTWGEIERRTVNMFLPVSRSVAEQTRLDGVPYRIVPNFIPDTIETPDENTEALLAQLPQNDFLLYVGDVMPDKGVDVLFQAHAKLNNSMPLVLIGRPVTGFLEHLPPNVLHLGRWPHSAIMQAWSRCALALIPSICPDACPTVAMEAMTMARPIIASRIGGLTDIVVEGQTGLLVSPGDPLELQEAIQSLLDHPERGASMAMMAKQRVVEFQAKSVVPRIEHVYREVLTSCS